MTTPDEETGLATDRRHAGEAEDFDNDTGSNGAHSYWPTDTGTLEFDSRRVLVALVKGPYLSAARHRELWRVLINDEAQIRSRLADLFLELTVDPDFELAFVRGVKEYDERIPQVVRTASLTLLDSAMVLYLREEMSRVGPGLRCIVGKDVVAEHMQLYRQATSTDFSIFNKRVSAAWGKLEKAGVLLKTASEDRFEVSPALRLIFSNDEIEALRAQYRRLRSDSSRDAADAAALTDSSETADAIKEPLW